MSRHADSIRLQPASGPLAARQLLDLLGISQPTLSRALAELGGEIVRLARAFLARVVASGGFSRRFGPCIISTGINYQSLNKWR